MSTKQKKEKTIYSAEREVIRNVTENCKEQAWLIMAYPYKKNFLNYRKSISILQCITVYNNKNSSESKKHVNEEL